MLQPGRALATLKRKLKQVLPRAFFDATVQHIPKSDHFKKMCALLGFQPEIEIRKMTISTIPMNQNRSISPFAIVWWSQTRLIIILILDI